MDFSVDPVVRVLRTGHFSLSVWVRSIETFDFPAPGFCFFCALFVVG